MTINTLNHETMKVSFEFLIFFYNLNMAPAINGLQDSKVVQPESAL